MLMATSRGMRVKARNGKEWKATSTCQQMAKNWKVLLSVKEGGGSDLSRLIKWKLKEADDLTLFSAALGSWWWSSCLVRTWGQLMVVFTRYHAEEESVLVTGNNQESEATEWEVMFIIIHHTDLYKCSMTTTGGLIMYIRETKSCTSSNLMTPITIEEATTCSVWKTCSYSAGRAGCLSFSSQCNSSRKCKQQVKKMTLTIEKWLNKLINKNRKYFTMVVLLSLYFRGPFLIKAQFLIPILLLLLQYAWVHIVLITYEIL